MTTAIVCGSLSILFLGILAVGVWRDFRSLRQEQTDD